MNIPEPLNSAIEDDSSSVAMLHMTVATVEPWFRQSGTPFFPEYTDHGLSHVQGVIETIAGLIPPRCYDLLTGGDALCITLAALLHDAAMHLLEDGFMSLITDVDRYFPLRGYDDKPWPYLWSQFMLAASRFDERTLHALLGDPHPPAPFPDDAAAFTLKHRLLVGEFLRRHHHRLAHDIAVRGVPTAGEPFPILPAGDERLVDMVGHIARSHGMGMRDCLRVVQQQYHIREWRGIHPTYLMALLRVADYMQIERDRAPAAVLRIRRLRSPLSQREWAMHIAVEDVKQVHDDPERLEVTAYPDNVRSWIKIKEWLTGFQSELDSVWAVLGEVYGRFPPLDKLGLTFRRVASNLDANEHWAVDAPFVDRAASFQVATTPEVLPLLIQPLYGQRPDIGVRELIQNAVDAVITRRALQGTGVRVHNEFMPHRADILVTFERIDNVWWLGISDKGIGMTPEDITDYFLRIGATFRVSPWWREHFVDDDGHATVIRSGRFGIGILAAFLLGDEVRVSTRHATMPRNRGIRFSATMAADLIQLDWTERPVGTTIKVPLTTAASKALGLTDDGDTQRRLPGGCSWYRLEDPPIDYHVPGASIRTPARAFHPPHTDRLPVNWRLLRPSGYASVLWTHGGDVQVTCNGFIIPDARLPEWDIVRGNVSIRRPSVAVFDPDGQLPLNLQRLALTTPTLPFDAELRASVVDDVVAALLAGGPSVPLGAARGCDEYVGATYQGIDVAPNGPSLLMSTGHGYALLDAWTLAVLNIGSIILLPVYADYMELPAVPVHDDLAYGAYLFEQPDRGRWTRSLTSVLEMTWDANRPGGPGRGSFAGAGARLIFFGDDRDKAREAFSDRRIGVTVEAEDDKLLIAHSGRCPAHSPQLIEVALALVQQRDAIPGASLTWPGCVMELYLQGGRAVHEMSVLDNAWQRLIGRNAIPFDPADRRRVLESSFAALAPYIAAKQRGLGPDAVITW